MDRNNGKVNVEAIAATVALRKESVDRNLPVDKMTTTATTSLSARRAWIEIMEK